MENPAREHSMGRTARIRQQIVKLLEKEGKCHTRRIYEHVNDSSRWGATMNQISNVLSKDKRFRKSEAMVRVGRMGQPRYSVCEWELKETYRQNNSDDNHD